MGLLQSLIFLLLGFWPALIVSFTVTGISVVRVPWNIVYHCLVTYRTVMLRRSLKLWSIPMAAALAFAGYPHKPWLKTKPLIKKFWTRYVDEMEAHVRNYGHETGIPENWD